MEREADTAVVHQAIDNVVAGVATGIVHKLLAE